MTKLIALLPMRAGSKRVTKKNIRDFSGMPLFMHVLNSLLNTDCIEKIIIDTDCQDIKQRLPKGEKIIVQERPAELAGDFASMNDVIHNAIKDYDEEQLFVQVHATSPLLRSQTIDDAASYFITQQNQYDSLFSVTEIKARFFKQDGTALNHNPNELIRTQDLVPIFEENSAFYIFSKGGFEAANGKRIGEKPLMHPISALEAVDIDTEEDFLMAQSLYEFMSKNQMECAS